MSKQTNSKMVSWEMKWVMGKYLTKPYQSFGFGVGLLTGYKAAHWLRNVPLTSYLSSYSAKPPPTFLHHHACSAQRLPLYHLLWLFCHEGIPSQQGLFLLC